MSQKTSALLAWFESVSGVKSIGNMDPDPNLATSDYKTWLLKKDVEDFFLGWSTKLRTDLIGADNKFLLALVSIVSLFGWLVTSVLAALNSKLNVLLRKIPMLSKIPLLDTVERWLPIQITLAVAWLFADMVQGISLKLSQFLLLITGAITTAVSYSLNGVRKWIVMIGGIIQIIFALTKLGVLNNIIKSQMVFSLLQLSTVGVVALLITDWFLAKSEGGVDSVRGRGNGASNNNNNNNPESTTSGLLY